YTPTAGARLLGGRADSTIRGLLPISASHMMPTEVATVTTIRTTLALPSELLAEVDRIVRAGGAGTRNALIADALRRELKARRRLEVDGAFATMGTDPEDERLAEQIMAEFRESDVETSRDID